MKNDRWNMTYIVVLYDYYQEKNMGAKAAAIKQFAFDIAAHGGQTADLTDYFKRKSF